ncbi:hypothetical protein PV327_006532 [Microctonus hyperodae]|uniref:Uncharacterized protein n=1 Tax=Microctonus hyperodae TaxID=165561 RepID=A0AA39F4H5_MICHY|nr:hypothetical protein PV327_006532 [Microctonus hyperodae]
MEKRKLMLDINGGQKFSFRHPTIIDTQPKSNHIVRNIGKSMLKVKFTSNNNSSDSRSISSSRLKSFPAEEMRKLYKSPRPNVFPFPTAINACQSQTPTSGNNKNSGQGDSILPQSTLPQIISHHHNKTLSQHHLTHPMSNQIQRSEILTKSNSHHPSTEDRQTHRPFVPNTPRHSKQKKPQTTLNSPTITSVNEDNFDKDEISLDEANIQSKSESNNLNKTSNLSQYEEQSVGGRNAAIYRQIHLSQVRHPTTANYTMSESQILNQSHQNPEFHYQFQQQKPSGAAWTQSMIAKNPELYYSCQYTKKKLGNNQRSINSSSVQQYQPDYPPRRSKNTQKDENKNLTFTPAMIRDQELLVTTMGQQGISEEIMKRQFDALLTEQRRHLMYQQQFEMPEENKEESDEVGIPIRRRISKFNNEEKPEWMMRITPPRIPYALIEKMENESTKERKKSVRFDGNFNEKQQQTQQQMQQKQECTYLENNQKCGTSFHNIYQQQPLLIHNIGHHCENLYCQTHGNSISYATQQTQNNVDGMTMYKHQMKNGLQDIEMVEKTMEELQNVPDCKGFEHLINLNKTNQHVQLNGVQDDVDSSKHNLLYRPTSEDIKDEMKKGVSSNDLVNKRNSHNPSTSLMGQLRNYDLSNSEYPKRKVYDSQIHENTQMPEPHLEARIIGGIKYIARKIDNISYSDAPEVSIGSKFPIQSLALH